MMFLLTHTCAGEAKWGLLPGDDKKTPALDRVLFCQIFRRWLVVSEILEEANEVPREFVQLIRQDLPILFRELVQAKPDLWEA